MAKTVIVIPVYNEAERLDAEAFRTYLASHTWLSLYFVDDGSTDDSPERLSQLAATDPERITVLRLASNMGKGEAVRQGIVTAINASPCFVGYWDADLSTPLTAIADMRQLLVENECLQAVIGSRVKLLGRQIIRQHTRHYLGRVFATFASIVLNIGVYDTQCGAKVFRVTEELKAVFTESFLSRWIFDVELMARLVIANAVDNDRLDFIYEMPLQRWEDIGGSKVRWYTFLRAALDLLIIARRYGGALHQHKWTKFNLIGGSVT